MRFELRMMLFMVPPCARARFAPVLPRLALNGYDCTSGSLAASIFERLPREQGVQGKVRSGDVRGLVKNKKSRVFPPPLHPLNSLHSRGALMGAGRRQGERAVMPTADSKKYQ